MLPSQNDLLLKLDDNTISVYQQRFSTAGVIATSMCSILKMNSKAIDNVLDKVTVKTAYTVSKLFQNVPEHSSMFWTFVADSCHFPSFFDVSCHCSSFFDVSCHCSSLFDDSCHCYCSLMTAVILIVLVLIVLQKHI